MEQMLNPQFYVTELDAGRSWLTANAFLLSVSTIGQMIVVIAAFLGARSIAPRAQVILERVTQGRRYEVQLRRIAAALAPLASPIAWLTLLWLSVLMALQAELAHPVITIVVNLLTAWVAIRLSASLVRDPVWSRTKSPSSSSLPLASGAFYEGKTRRQLPRHHQAHCRSHLERFMSR